MQNRKRNDVSYKSGNTSNMATHLKRKQAGDIVTAQRAALDGENVDILIFPPKKYDTSWYGWSVNSTVLVLCYLIAVILSLIYCFPFCNESNDKRSHFFTQVQKFFLSYFYLSYFYLVEYFLHIWMILIYFQTSQNLLICFTLYMFAWLNIKFHKYQLLYILYFQLLLVFKNTGVSYRKVSYRDQISWYVSYRANSVSLHLY